MYLLYCSELNYTYIEFIHKALGKSVNHIPVDRKVNQKAIGAQSTLKKIEKVSHFQPQFCWAHRHWTLMLVIYCFIHRDNCFSGNHKIYLPWKHNKVKRNRVLCRRWHDHVTISVHSGGQKSFVSCRHDLSQCRFYHLRLWGIKEFSVKYEWHFVESVRTYKANLLPVTFLRFSKQHFNSLNQNTSKTLCTFFLLKSTGTIIMTQYQTLVVKRPFAMTFKIDFH